MSEKIERRHVLDLSNRQVELLFELVSRAAVTGADARPLADLYDDLRALKTAIETKPEG